MKIFAPFALCIVLVSIFEVSAQLQITEFGLDDTSVTLIFEDANGVSNQFTLQTNAGLGAADWVNADTASLVELGNNLYRFTIPATAADLEFYRIIGDFLGDGVDPDGDGLPTAFEETIGTNATRRDSDGDGFNDGVEYAVGTDPNDRTDFPDQAHLPAISFVESSMTVTEGEGVVSIPITVDDPSKSYSGSVSVSVTGIGTAEDGVDFTVPGGTTISNGSGNLPLSLIDDLEIAQELRLLILEIESDPGVYASGAQFRTTIVIADNDNYWSGGLRSGYSEINFRLRIRRQGATTEAEFVAGSENDGLPVPEGGTQSDQSSGIVPVGVFPATVASDTPTAFDITSPPMFAGQSSLFGESLQLARTVRLMAESSEETPAITALAIFGTYEETVSDPTGDSPHLGFFKTGEFVLVKDIPGQPELQLFPANP